MERLKQLLEELYHCNIYPDMSKFYSYVNFRFGTIKQAVIKGYFSQNKSYAEIALKLGLSPSFVSNVVKESVKGYYECLKISKKDKENLQCH